MEAQRSAVQGRKRAAATQEPGSPVFGVGELQSLEPGIPPRGKQGCLRVCLRALACTAPLQPQTHPGQGSCWHCPLQAQRTTRVVRLGL